MIVASDSAVRGRAAERKTGGPFLLRFDVLTWAPSIDTSKAATRSMLGLLLSLLFPIAVAVYFGVLVEEARTQPDAVDSRTVDAVNALRIVRLVPRAFAATDALAASFTPRNFDATTPCARAAAAQGAALGLQRDGSFAVPICPTAADQVFDAELSAAFPALPSGGSGGLYVRLAGALCPMMGRDIEKPYVLLSNFSAPGAPAGASPLAVLDVVYGSAKWTLDASMLNSIVCNYDGSRGSEGVYDMTTAAVVQISVSLSDTTLSSGAAEQAISVLDVAASELNTAPILPDDASRGTCNRGPNFSCECNATNGAPLWMGTQSADFAAKCARACARCLAHGFAPLPDVLNATPVTLVGPSVCPLVADLVSGYSGTDTCAGATVQTPAGSTVLAKTGAALGFANASANPSGIAPSPTVPCVLECGWLGDVGGGADISYYNQARDDGKGGYTSIYINESAFVDCYRWRANGAYDDVLYPDGTGRDFDPVGRCFRVFASALEAVPTLVAPAVKRAFATPLSPLPNPEPAPGGVTVTTDGTPWGYTHWAPDNYIVDATNLNPGYDGPAFYSSRTFSGQRNLHTLPISSTAWALGASPEDPPVSPLLLILLRAGPAHTVTVYRKQPLDLLTIIGATAGTASLFFATLLILKRCASRGVAAAAAAVPQAGMHRLPSDDAKEDAAVERANPLHKANEW